MSTGMTIDDDDFVSWDGDLTDMWKVRAKNEIFAYALEANAAFHQAKVQLVLKRAQVGRENLTEDERSILERTPSTISPDDPDDARMRKHLVLRRDLILKKRQEAQFDEIMQRTQGGVDVTPVPAPAPAPVAGDSGNNGNNDVTGPTSQSAVNLAMLEALQ
mmetsp:Transcript_8712/g.22235  ORF Transcript_8712/g.22235 Transcript_8712/m.22235 type:complete len:161 (+) Transcript_8712:1049-1531(+)